MGLLSLATIPAKLKLYGLLGVGALVLIGGAFGAGYLEGEKNFAVKETKSNATEIVKWQTKLQTQRVEVKVRDIAREKQLQSDLAAITAQRDSLKGILNEKPDLDPTVHLRLGDVRMLDAAAGGASVRGVSDPALLASYEEQAASAVGLRSFVGTELDVREQYNALAKQHDALVDWVNVELIQQQLDNAKKNK